MSEHGDRRCVGRAASAAAGFSLVLTAVLFWAAGAAAASNQANQEAFERRVAPILRQHCAACHSGDNPASDLAVHSYDSLLEGGKRGPALIPGRADESLLVKYVKGIESPRMPLGGSLPEETVAKLESAVNALEPLAEKELPKDDYTEWLFAPPERPELPEVEREDWPVNAIDRFILAKLESKGMEPAPRADRLALLRRVYFDLIGLPPAPEEAEAFLNDTSPQAYERLVERLLADPRYGERWGRHWLDLVRYAESDGFAVDRERPTAWRYRDYVIRSFNQDKPYDLFIKEQLAGDELRDERAEGQHPSERLVALGFLRMGPWEIDANSKKQLRQDFLNEVAKTTGEVFLGLTVGCAQCHDHKYDPIPQRDFYRMQAFFAATTVENRPAPHAGVEHAELVQQTLRDYEDRAEAAGQELERRKEELVERFRQIHQVAEDDEKVKDFLNELNVANAFFQDREGAIFETPQWEAYLAAKDEAQRLNELVARYKPMAYAVEDLVPPDVPAIPETHLLKGGELDSKGAVVEPGFLEAVEGKAEPAKIPFRGGSSGRRTALAEWIASKDNPLTARVMVNRIWQHHFGQGLVRTPSNFGKNGERPTHPELLDWLAVEFVERGWSVKQMHRLMLTSAAYRQSVEHPKRDEYAEQDAANRLLWRMNWQRLEAEVLRDSVLALSGRLNLKRGGPGALADVPPDVAEGFEFFKWFPSKESEQVRRSVYLFQRHSVVMPLMEVFDGANMSESCARRSRTTVPTQALTLINGELTNTGARYFAQRVLREAGERPEDQVERAFRLVLSRPPSGDERQQALELLAGAGPVEGLARLGVVLFNLNEFLYIR